METKDHRYKKTCFFRGCGDLFRAFASGAQISRVVGIRTKDVEQKVGLHGKEGSTGIVTSVLNGEVDFSLLGDS
jgi:hypothetical protein